MTLLKIYYLSRFFKSHYPFHFTHRYPQCLHFLELLQYEHFRRELVNPACAKFIDEQQILHWQYYSRKRMKINLPKSSGQTGSTAEGEPSWNCKLCRKKCGQDVSTEMANNLEIWVGSFNTKLSSSSFTLFFFIEYPLLSSLADIKVSVILTGYRSRIFLWQSCAMYNLLKLDPDNNLAEDQETEYFVEPIVYCVGHIFWKQKIGEYSNPQLHCLWYLEHALQDLKPGTHKATDSNRRKKN